MVITKRIYFLIGVPLLLLIFATLLGGFLIWKSSQDTRSLIQGTIYRQNLLSSIYYHAGYGAGVHHYKNLILRRDLTYLNPAKEHLSDVIEICDQYLYIDKISDVERKAVTQIKRTMEDYLAHADVAQVMINQGKSVAEIDRAVTMDETSAAAESLRIHDFLADEQSLYERKFQQYQLNVFILLSIIFCAVIVIAILLTNTVNSRIQRTIEAAVRMAREVASGNYKPDIDEKVADDLDSLFGDIRIMAESIQRKVELLQTSNSDLKRFAFIAAHDLQEPLNKIMAYADLMLLDDDEKLSPGAQATVKKIIASGNRLRSLVRDLLTYADLASTTRPNLDVNLNESLRHTRSALKEDIEAANALITAQDLPHVLGSPKHFESLFENLIANSLKYRDPVRLCMIDISCKLEGNMYKITLRDNGIGFDQRHVGQLMRPFVKLHDKGKYPGSGVGLAICSRILQIYESHLEIESIEGTGTVCSFKLPHIPSPQPYFERGATL